MTNLSVSRVVLGVAAVVVGMLTAPAAQAAEPVNEGTWTFDTQPITATAPVKLKTAFKATDRIYARVFYDKPVKTVFKFDSFAPVVKVAQHDKTTGLSNWHIDVSVQKKDFDKNYLDLEIFPDPATATAKYRDESFHSLWLEQKAVTGVHKVLYDLGDRAAMVTIDFSGFDAGKMAAARKEAVAAGQRAYAMSVDLPKPAALHSAALAKQAIATTMRDKSVAAAKVVFTDDQWNLEHDDNTGRVNARVADATLVMKMKSGKCLIDKRVYRQPRVGGKYGSGEWANTVAELHDFDCKKAFK